MNYYVFRDGQQYGPYTEETVRSYVAAGSLLATDNIRAETSQSWTTIGQLFQIPQAAPPAMAQPQMAPQYGQAPQYAAPVPYAQAPGAAQIVPPNLHWALLLILSITWIFAFIWGLVQASYARKIDAGSNALWAVILWIGLSTADFVLNYQAVTAGGQAPQYAAYLGIGGIICYFVFVFSIRSSMVTYYNSVEPIQLQLSGVMTFFFGMYYLQYHMSRIAHWKKTGILT